jgi:hypothetical protein
MAGGRGGMGRNGPDMLQSVAWDAILREVRGWEFSDRPNSGRLVVALAGLNNKGGWGDR